MRPPVGLLRHSKKPSAGTMARREWKAARNDDRLATVSARALNSRLPTDGSLAHDGISPHR